ncbi:hypothetical protein BJY01DRAFT_221669 [Aspergillus pseudoustus]|uniref:Uncharacterized protein n=1 Tax=Aspergillus pseudoustus TaxID=1810923 RepID=A0ABR4J9C9_9EURO
MLRTRSGAETGLCSDDGLKGSKATSTFYGGAMHVTGSLLPMPISADLPCCRYALAVATGFLYTKSENQGSRIRLDAG